MVKYSTYAPHPEKWLAEVKMKRGEKSIALLEKAIKLYETNHKDQLEKGIDIADILLTMGLDNESLIASILYPLIQKKELEFDFINDSFGENCGKLLRDASQMQSLGKLQHLQKRGQHQIENLRKMLLAMVKDVRAVIIVLAERLWLLRKAKTATLEDQQSFSKETMEVYAPLANRLGIWHLKWEMEDLCLRYLKPDIYKTIAKWLATRRQEREDYIKRMIEILSNMLKDAHLKKFEVTGRVKHIDSIYRKMTRKNSTLDQIYDISALRVLVPDVNDCYTVLSLIQNKWSQVQEEFDDYISQPKPNGYRSIHTVILGPEERYNEIQIRTFQMHQESELGVAAHWRYKEGVLQPSSYESKIALLRQIMDWQKEVVSHQEKEAEQLTQDLLSDRVYVFTPLGDIVDLPQGATPLDFAYHIHSELGHRCRGAKVNGNIVPLTYLLQMGERVEVITAKEAHPSRDWLNPHYGYLKTSKARAKAQHWFRMRDSLQTPSIEKGSIYKEPSKTHSVSAEIPLRNGKEERPSDIQILGVNNVLTKIARCCKPLPGDKIVGYITQNRGVSIHRTDCSNITHAAMSHKERLIDVNWSEKGKGAYPVDLQLISHDRSGLLRDITTMLASEKITVLGLNTTQTGANVYEAIIYLTIEISSMTQLKKAVDLLMAIPNVLEVRRR